MNADHNGIYISGPMTGYDNFNFDAFNKKEELLRESGWTDIRNPAEKGEIDGWEWEDYLRLDLRELLDCSTIYMLPGWSKSRGALLEHHVATKLGYKVMGAHA